MNRYPQVYLKPKKDESLRRFHPWVFSGAISHSDSVNDGDVVEVISSDGKFLAIGHYQIGSIAVRVLSFEDEIIDETFWEKRLNAALEVRKSNIKAISLYERVGFSFVGTRPKYYMDGEDALIYWLYRS